MNQPIWHGSPNFGPRRDRAVPTLIVLHYTAFTSAEAALDRLCDPVAEVSSHFLIGRSGTCWHLVDEAARAWHAGAGSWGGQGDVNSRSIGIEIDNDGASPFSEPAMAALEGLLGDLLGRWQIAPQGVIAHADMAPLRKSDPGPRFDWGRLALQGLACWPQASAADEGARAPEDAAPSATMTAPDAVQADLVHFGYPADVPFAALLAAFRARFRPWCRGPLDATDAAIARDLATRFPVDPGAPGS